MIEYFFKGVELAFGFVFGYSLIELLVVAIAATIDKMKRVK